MADAVKLIETNLISRQQFRIFQDMQPDGQRWELIEGVPVMMSPPKITHQKIAMNLTRLLDDAVSIYDPSFTAVFTPGVDLGLGSQILANIGRASGYVPEPDVAVIENLLDPDQRLVDRALVLAEVVSSTDEVVTTDGLAWIDIKSALYRKHAPCRAVLVVEQERVSITVWEKTDGTWSERTLRDLSSVLTIACCNLRCEVRDVYANTHLAPLPTLRPITPRVRS